MALSRIEDIVSSAFSNVSLGLEATELLEMVHVVTLQVEHLCVVRYWEVLSFLMK